MSKAEIRKIEKEASRIKKQRERLQMKDVKLAEAERAHTATVESVIIASIREAGLTRLPLPQLLENITNLGRVVTETSRVHDAVFSDQAGDDARAASESSGPDSGSQVDRERSKVIVKISSNASAANRKALGSAGLHWNGKIPGWTGVADQAAIAALRARFGSRVIAIGSQPGPDEGDQEGMPADPTPPPSNPLSGASAAPPPPTGAVERQSETEFASESEDVKAGEGSDGNGDGSSLLPQNARRPFKSLPRRPQTNGG